jgi:hypothetical protein
MQRLGNLLPLPTFYGRNSDDESGSSVERGTENAADLIALVERRFDATTQVSCAHRTELEIVLIFGSTGELNSSAKAVRR